MEYPQQGEKWILPASWRRLWNNPEYWQSLPAVSEHKTIYTVKEVKDERRAEGESQ